MTLLKPKFISLWKCLAVLSWLVPSLLMAAPGAVLWKNETLKVMHGPVLGNDGMLFVITASGANTNLTALSEAGQVRWSVPLSEAVIEEIGQRWEILSVGPDGSVYVSAGKSLFAYDTNGGLRFRFSSPNAARISTPCIGPEGNLYVAMQGPNKLASLTPKGGLLWIAVTALTDLPMEAPLMDADGSLYLLMQTGLVSFSRETIVRWQFKAQISSVVLSPEGLVYVLISRLDGRSPGLYALDPNGKNPFGTRVWYEPLWLGGGGGGPMTAVMATGGLLYCMNDPLSFLAFDRDGSSQWAFELTGMYDASMAVGRDGSVYLFTGEALYAVSRHGSLQWSKVLTLSQAAAPVISKSGTLYFTTRAADDPYYRRLWAVDTGVTSQFHPWPMPRGDFRRSGRSSVVEPADRFSRTRSLPDHKLEVLIEGPPSYPYRIEHSSNLKDWRAYTNGVSSNGATRFPLPAPVSSRSDFFRVGRP